MDAYRDDQEATIHMQAARIAAYERGELPVVARLRKIAVAAAAVFVLLAYMAGTVVGRTQASQTTLEQWQPDPADPAACWRDRWIDAAGVPHREVCLQLGEALVCLAGPLDTAP